MFADFAVLSKDYTTVPVDQVHTIESLLTMVGGKVVFSQGTISLATDVQLRNLNNN